MDQGLCVEVVSGGLPVALDPPDALRIHQLKPLKSADLSFSQVVDHGGMPLNEAIQKERTGKLLEIFRELQPDLLVTELFPFGRRRFCFELLPLLDAARAGKTPVICSVRDSVQQHSEDRETETITWYGSTMQKCSSMVTSTLYLLLIRSAEQARSKIF